MRILAAFLVLLPGVAAAQTPHGLTGPEVLYSLTHPSPTVLPSTVLPTGPGGVQLLDSTGSFVVAPSVAVQASTHANDFAVSSITALSDTIKQSTTVYGAAMLSLLDVLPGGHTGARDGLVSEVRLNGPSLPASGNRNYVGGYFRGVANSGDGGTLAAPLGAVFGANPVAQCAPGATFLLDCTAAENDVGLYAGASAAFRTGQRIASFGTVKATTLDAALAITTLDSGSTGFNRGIVFSKLGGPNPVDGILISGAGTGATAVGGLDFTGYTFSGYSLALPGGFIVSPTGLLTNGGITTGSVAMSGTLTAPFIRATAAAIPKVIWNGTGNGTDLKKWQSYVQTNGNFEITSLNDAENAAVLAMSISRNTDGSVGFVSFPPKVLANNGITVTGTAQADQFNSNGIFGVSCAAGSVSASTMVVTNGIVTHC